MFVVFGKFLTVRATCFHMAESRATLFQVSDTWEATTNSSWGR